MNSYYEMKHHIILDDDERYPLELNYHIYTESHDINTFDSTLESAFKLKIYNEPSTAIKTSERERCERLKLFHKIFTQHITQYDEIMKGFRMGTPVPAQYQIFNLLPYQLSLNISADKEFKEQFLIIPYEKVVKQNVFTRGNFKVEILSEENRIIDYKFINENSGDYFVHINTNEIYSANQMRVLLDDKKDEDNSIHKTKSLFE